MYKVSVTIWALIATAIGLVVLFTRWPALARQYLGNDPELFKLTYQFLLITVVGGGVTLLFRQLDRLREMRVALRGMHSELLEGFNQAKAVRRRLRAQLGTLVSIVPDTVVSAELYDDGMDTLSDAQLTLEIHAKRAKDIGGLWFLGNPKLTGPLGRLEFYLGEIEREYEEKRSKFFGTPPQYRIGDLPKLAEFIGPYDQAAKFKEDFKYPMREALKALSKAVLQ